MKFPKSFCFLIADSLKKPIPVCRDISIADIQKPIKKSGAQPSVCPRAALPLYFESVDYLIFPTVQTAEIEAIRDYDTTIRKRKAEMKSSIEILDGIIKDGAISDNNLRLLLTIL